MIYQAKQEQSNHYIHFGMKGLASALQEHLVNVQVHISFRSKCIIKASVFLYHAYLVATDYLQSLFQITYIVVFFALRMHTNS